MESISNRLTSSLQRRRLVALATVSVVLTLGALACNSSNSPTGPYGGGGGGGGGGAGGTIFNLGPFALGQSSQIAFANAGTFGYHCNIHRNMGMVGTVQVDASGADSALVQIGPGNGFTFSPASAHIKPGGKVRWLNVSNLAIHTVTSDQ